MRDGSSLRGEEITAGGVDVNVCPGAVDRDRVPVVQPLPAHVGGRQKRLRLVRGRRSACRRTKPRHVGDELLERFGLADKREEYPDRLWAASSNALRSFGARHAARSHAARRGDERARPGARRQVLEVIRELAAEGMTMLIATHEMGFARDVAHRVCFLDAGIILEEGSPSQIFGEPKEPRTQQFLERIVRAGRL